MRFFIIFQIRSQERLRIRANARKANVVVVAETYYKTSI